MLTIGLHLIFRLETELGREYHYCKRKLERNGMCMTKTGYGLISEKLPNPNLEVFLSI
jgi:hypothetical protein